MTIDKNILVLMQRLAVACEQNHRDRQEMRVLLATKDQPVEIIREAVNAGLHLCGENKVQELVKKSDAMKTDDVVWHFIGNLQTNKVKECISIATCVQSVDRTDLVDELEKQCIALNRHLDIMIEVNTSGEKSKIGCQPEDVESLLTYIAAKPRLHVRGFMTIGANSSVEATVRSGFSTLRTIRDTAIQRELIPKNAFELSMGMSSDLEWAIAEGSTMIRVGSGIFGSRS